MSVHESDRVEGELAVFTKTRAFVIRTLRLCSNEKYFPKRLRWVYASHLCSEANKMYSLIIKANSIYVESESEAHLRVRYWKQALAYSYSVMAYIDMALDISNISWNRIRSWDCELKDIQDLIRNRIKSDTKRFING